MTTVTTFTRTVVHLSDMPCLIEAGDTTSASTDDITCAACIGNMPTSFRCQHRRIFVESRPFVDGVHPPTRTAGYRWVCVCGYRTTILLEDTPARWLATEDNPQRLARIQAQVAND
jgi:hypothetical protein